MLVAAMGAKKTRRLDPSDISARVERGRVDAGLAVKEMAAKVGLSPWAWYKKAAATNPWTLEELERIADVLDAPTLWPFVEWEVGIVIDRHLGRRQS